AAADWPCFRGPTGMGASPETGLPAEWGPAKNIAWKAELPGAGTSSPIILGDRLYLTCYSGYNVPRAERGSPEDLVRHVICMKAGDGAVIWKKDFPAKLPEQKSIRDDHGYASSTPAADAERVYVFFGKSGVFALDRQGRELWHADVGSGTNGWGSAASPVIAGDFLIVNASVESETLIALDKKTGEEKWRASGIKESWNTPILVATPGGATELVLAIAGRILGFDPATGAQLWSCATDIGWYMVPSLVAKDGLVCCIGGRSGGALAVRAGGRGDVTATHRIWTGTKGSNVSSPVLHEGRLFWMHENSGTAYCADAATGAIVYEERIAGTGQVYASPVLAGGKIYYLARNGRAFTVAAAPRFALLATNDLGDRSAFNASPAVAAGRLFIRSDKHLYCIGPESTRP
ncbi:MAG TPA: serine/threonine protein kinase, partial [Planctomycetes bacterium]|nr:serine/threonine protein kinase [Planctomycetota bacterium]